MSEGTNQIATVAVVSPFTVRLKGKTTNTVVQRLGGDVPVDLAEGQRVLVTVVERQLTFLHRWDAI